MKKINKIKMSELRSNYHVLVKVPTRARTEKGIINAIRKADDAYKEFPDDEMQELINSDFAEICEDGVVLLYS